MILPEIIQGGMGAGVSDWRLAQAVSSRGHLGVISGTALDVILARRLQLGDPDGHLRRALAQFPDPAVAERILDRYYIPEGKSPDAPFATTPMVGHQQSPQVQELLIAANFVEVFLAKEGHSGKVGINYLHKIQAPLLPSLYGAMLAGVDAVLVGAGIPLELPAIISGLSRGETVHHTLHVQGAAKGHQHQVSFSPLDSLRGAPPRLEQPLFLAIVSSVTLATVMVRKCKDQLAGLIVELPSAGGHNAPPRGPIKVNPEGETVYGPRDEIAIEAIQALGVPFWLAGSYATPLKLAEARKLGASGIQAGTVFAFSDESGLSDALKKQVITTCHERLPPVFRDPVASPTGFPFQVLALAGSLSEAAVYHQRCRQCDLGYLREAYERADGSLGWRCPAEVEDAYIRKGGNQAETAGRKCLCNALMANIGMPQCRQDKSVELPLVTCGEDLSAIRQLAGGGRASYSAADVLDFLLSGSPA